MEACQYLCSSYFVLHLEFGHGHVIDKHCWMLEMLSKLCRIGTDKEIPAEKSRFVDEMLPALSCQLDTLM